MIAPWAMKRSCKYNDHSQRGFTMIEMIVVLIVMTIFITIVVTRYTSVANELMAEEDGLKASIRFVQNQSMYDDTESPAIKWGIRFPDATTYRLYKNNADASSTMIPVKGLVGDEETAACPKNCHKLQGNVQISSGIGTTINFDRWGRPLDESGNIRTGSLSLGLTKSTETRTITVTKYTGYIP